ncbi:MAG: aldehyde dehydrogenase family protein, partial [Hymenobacter sp.]|nr:aldehyde dehydrogenase family protein [Hymenobacter sp.]
MPKIISPQVEFSGLLNQMKIVVPEVFSPDGKILNLLEGRWQQIGTPREFTSPVDGSQLGWMPMLNRETALRGVLFAKGEAAAWAATDLDERKRKVQDCLVQLRQHVELTGRLIMWEIGKTYKLGFTDIDRAIEGVQWYVDNIEGMLGQRKPLGLVSNIASWNYPMSVLLHAVLVQVLAGNAVVAKTPTDGGFISLSLTFAVARRCG